MAKELQLVQGARTAALTDTTLESLADGNIWSSGEITRTSPVSLGIKVFYELAFNAAPAEGDSIVFRIAESDGAGTPVYPAGLATTADLELTSGTTPDVETVKSALPPAWTHTIIGTSHPVGVTGSFTFFPTSDDFIILIEALGEALAGSASNVVGWATLDYQQQA